MVGVGYLVTVNTTEYRAVFGRRTFSVAFGVTAIVALQVPALSPRILDPAALQILLDDDLTVITTRAPRGGDPLIRFLTLIDELRFRNLGIFGDRGTELRTDTLRPLLGTMLGPSARHVAVDEAHSVNEPWPLEFVFKVNFEVHDDRASTSVVLTELVDEALNCESEISAPVIGSPVPSTATTLIGNAVPASIVPGSGVMIRT
jgi:hypothetical protein